VIIWNTLKKQDVRVWKHQRQSLVNKRGELLDELSDYHLLKGRIPPRQFVMSAWEMSRDQGLLSDRISETWGEQMWLKLWQLF
jgi:hypothetical protein